MFIDSLFSWVPWDSGLYFWKAMKGPEIFLESVALYFVRQNILYISFFTQSPTFNEAHSNANGLSRICSRDLEFMAKRSFENVSVWHVTMRHRSFKGTRYEGRSTKQWAVSWGTKWGRIKIALNGQQAGRYVALTASSKSALTFRRSFTSISYMKCASMSL